MLNQKHVDIIVRGQICLHQLSFNIGFEDMYELIDLR